MSYILDALKKADQERSLGDVPDLEAAHWGERLRQRSYRWVWILGALLLINGALLFMLLGRDDATTSGDEVLSPRTDSPQVAPVQQRVSPVAPPPVEIVRPREPVYVPPAVPVKPPPLVTQSLPLDDTPSPAFSPPPAPVRVPAAVSGVPDWNDLSLEFRSGLTLPRIDVHVYSDDPGRRFILADMQKFREGETLDSGAVLEKILPGSIQLYYQGTRFRVEK